MDKYMSRISTKLPLRLKRGNRQFCLPPVLDRVKALFVLISKDQTTRNYITQNLSFSSVTLDLLFNNINTGTTISWYKKRFCGVYWLWECSFWRILKVFHEKCILTMFVYFVFCSSNVLEYMPSWHTLIMWWWSYKDAKLKILKTRIKCYIYRIRKVLRGEEN